MKFRDVALSSATALIILLGCALTLSSGEASGGATGASCGRQDATTVMDSGMTVAGYSGDQLANAAQIMNAATAADLPQQAQILGVMTAIGESSLRNLTYGDSIHGVTNPDGTPTSSVGLFQQQEWWGSLGQRLDPFQSATLFFDRLSQLPRWELLTPTAAAHSIQGNADADYYTPFYAPAAEIVSALTSAAGGGCAISGNAQLLAQELVIHADNATLSGLVPDHIKEIRWIAHGASVSGCGIDTRILQVMVIAVRHFPTVGVGSINRNCTGERLGAGTQSSHNINGGGYAVDFYSLDGLPLTGADGQSIRLISLLDPVMPPGARVGQSDCRIIAGTTMELSRFSQFPDGCDHLHIDVAYSNFDTTLALDQHPT